MDKALATLKEYIDERVAYVTDDPEWQSKKESERLWKEFVEAFLEAWKARNIKELTLDGIEDRSSYRIRRMM